MDDFENQGTETNADGIFQKSLLALYHKATAYNFLLPAR